MVSCYETSKEEGPSADKENALCLESSKTKEEDEVVASLLCLPSLFNIHEMV